MEENKPKLVTEKKIVKIDDIIPNPYNPNVMPDYLFQKMKQVIAEKGLFGSVYVRPLAGCYQILDGEHRWRAMKELGYKEIPVECSVVEITDDETKFWTIYFNNMKGKDDIQKRSLLLTQMSNGQTQLLPMSEEEIENEKKLTNWNFDAFVNKEKLEEKVITRTFMVGLNEEQHSMVTELMKQVKETYGQEPVDWLMEKVEGDLSLFLGRNMQS